LSNSKTCALCRMRRSVAGVKQAPDPNTVSS
jgi:hypothetical protein